MKLKSIISISFWAISIVANAQTFSPAMENAIKVCQELSTAIRNSSTAPLKTANSTFKASNIIDFNDLALCKGKDISVDGHFVFDEEFVDSLIENREILQFASKYVLKRSTRASRGGDGGIRLTTKALKAGKSATWKTVNRGTAEFAVVAEPGGLLTMTIRDTKGNVLYAETTNNKQGEPMRKVQLELPQNKRTTLFIEIVNHAKVDTSFALMKN